MGQFLMRATVFQSVAILLSQLSQPRSTLRHCASCLSPYGGKALTGAVLLRGLLAQNRSVANPIGMRWSRRGFRLARIARADRSHSAARNEIKNQGRPIAFRARCAEHLFEITRILIFFEFKPVGMDAGMFFLNRFREGHRIGRRPENFWVSGELARNQNSTEIQRASSFTGFLTVEIKPEDF